MKKKVAIIGLGHQATEDHVPALESSEDVDFVGVVDTNEKALNNFVKKHKGIKAYRSFDELINGQDLDFIIIATPHHTHFKLAQKALENNIHVLKEKPFALSMKDAKTLEEMSRQRKVKISVTMQRRFNPIYATFFQLIDKIGKIFFIDAKYTFFTDEPEVGWRGKKKLAGGGCLLDMGYHMVDLIIWYFGLPDAIFCEASCKAKEGARYDAEDTAKVIFKYKNTDMWGSLLISRVIPPKQESMDIFGTRGRIHLERGKIERYSKDGNLIESLSRADGWPAAAQDQIEYFVKVINGKKRNLTGPDFHLNHVAFVQAAYESKKKGKYINPKEYLKNDKK